MDDGLDYVQAFTHTHTNTMGCPDIDWAIVVRIVCGTLIHSKTYCKTCVCGLLLCVSIPGMAACG